MWTLPVNAADILPLCTTRTIREMESLHPSVARLVEYIDEHMPGKLRAGGGRWADLGRLVGVTPQILNNWKARGISRDGAIAIEDQLGVSWRWLTFGEGEPSAAKGQPPRAHGLGDKPDPDIARLAAYYLELGPDEQAAVMADLHARAARVVGARALLAATGYEPPAPVETHALSPEALRLATHFDHLNPEARKLAFAMAEAQLVKASQRFEVAPTDDAPAAPAATKPRPVRS